MATLPGSGASAQRAKTSHADAPVTPEKLRAAIPLLDAYAQNIVESGAIPGFSIGVVYNDQVVYLKGFGALKAGKPDRIDADTVFQLASLPKPISSTVISALVTEGKVTWDDPLVKHDPGFRMHDPALTPLVTIGDMFSHRSGLYGQAGNDLEQLGYSQQAILERLPVLANAYPFRQDYQYSNYGLTQGAIAAAMTVSQPWPDVAASKLYAPLSMTSTSSRYSDFASRPNRAHLHVLLNGTWVPLVTRVADA
jgi:CubicO group peptidase (beta-lactamase class C family)